MSTHFGWICLNDQATLAWFTSTRGVYLCLKKLLIYRILEQSQKKVTRKCITVSIAWFIDFRIFSKKRSQGSVSLFPVFNLQNFRIFSKKWSQKVFHSLCQEFNWLIYSEKTWSKHPQTSRTTRKTLDKVFIGKTF